MNPTPKKQIKSSSTQFDSGKCVHEAERRCHMLFEKNQDAALLATPNGRVLAANSKACQMFGMTEDELKVKGIEEAGSSNELITALKRKTDLTKTVFTFKRKGGLTFEGEVSISFFGDCDGVTKVSIVIRDVTELRKTDQEFKENEEKYRNLFEHMINGFAYCRIITNKEGEPTDFIYLEVNDAFERLTGIKKKEVCGKKATEAFPGIKEVHPELFGIYARVALSGKPEQFEIYFKPLSIWLSISVYSPKKGFFATVFENTTEQKQNEKKIEEHSEGLELTVASRTQELTETHERLLKAERFAAIGELAGMVGHDLRNPLTSIRNAAYYLNRRRGTSADEKEKLMFEIIDKSVEHANKIIGNLLEYAREITVEIEECTPKSLIDYVLLITQIPVNVKIHDHTEDKPTMWLDANKMERVFINLIQNAVDAMPQGGALEITSEQKGENVDFTFKDTGSGMTDQTKAKIFLPLFTTKAQGMGFGLAICKRIAEAHGGKITVDSILGKGTTFIITLPAEQKMQIQDGRSLILQNPGEQEKSELLP